MFCCWIRQGPLRQRIRKQDKVWNALFTSVFASKSNLQKPVPWVVCQPAASSLHTGRVNPGDEGIGGYRTGCRLSTCFSPHLKKEMHNSRPSRTTFANVLLVACGIFKSIRCTAGVKSEILGVAQSWPLESTVAINCNYQLPMGWTAPGTDCNL